MGELKYVEDQLSYCILEELQRSDGTFCLLVRNRHVFLMLWRMNKQQWVVAVVGRNKTHHHQGTSGNVRTDTKYTANKEIYLAMISGGDSFGKGLNVTDFHLHVKVLHTSFKLEVLIIHFFISLPF